jgi:Protein of unknown function (DUF3617)
MRRRFVLSAALIAGCLAAAPACALDLPQRKAGLWELKMSFQGRRDLPGRAMRQCVDAQTDKLMNSGFGGGAAAQSCTQRKVSPSPGGFTVDSVCAFNGATTTTHAVIAGDFNSAYTVQATSTRSGGRPMPGMPAGGTSHMSLSAKWLGACPAGTRPGDIMMGNGMKMNVLDLRKMGGVHRPVR